MTRNNRATFDMRSLLALLAGGAVVLIWSTAFSLSREAIKDLGVWPFRFYSLLAGLLPIAVFLPKSMRELRTASIEERHNTLIVAVINGFVVSTVNVIALAFFPAPAVLTLMYTMPAITSLIEIVSGKRLHPFAMLAPIVAVVGVLLYIGGSSFGAGAMLVLINASAWAFATILAGRPSHSISGISRVALQCILAFVLNLPFFFIFTVVPKGSIPLPSWNDLLAILYSGVLNGAVAFWLWYYAIAGIGVGRAAYLTLLVPVAGSVFASAFFGDELGPRQVLGIALVSGSMLLRVSVPR
ncbi:hypothetical protein ATY30_13640 [Sinorhizobium americanum]|uniref:EamA domain-containing protein n=2 Tax=Sinorhizobium TaxID=28105 RepID=A0A2S3YQ80_9HYPH|nr:hypothetical protein CO656_27820 [Sinorhizobium sp. FG01]PDT48314.1 hypothetical protein CO664_29010 [Sinorhizobium sp. NG07B]POH29955.1 hypothetical protein ATY30_13640 [Sinorhizobium americanum]POH33207.1 hypothetical protein ATY31_11145 [Sinorhizobium americanum]